ncbi:MAG: hypothetical protein SX243_15330 [Acidobacteriota bacterium]|nr:hypothetical protein [Acidobacteriota bacterium]
MFRALLFAVLSLLLCLSAFTPLEAQGPKGQCGGSYYIEEDGGARDVWTFSADGTFFGTTSTQPLIGFSDQQGHWQRQGQGGEGVLLTFVFNDDNTLLTVGRVEIEFQADDIRCNRISGSLSVRTFEDGEDPLDPSTDTGDPIAEDTFVGRRIRAGS